MKNPKAPSVDVNPAELIAWCRGTVPVCSECGSEWESDHHCATSPHPVLPPVVYDAARAIQGYEWWGPIGLARRLWENGLLRREPLPCPHCGQRLL